MDDESVEMVVKQLDLVNPVKRSPFYVLIETSGSDYDHDKQVTFICCYVYTHIVLLQKLHTFIESVFNDKILIDGTIANSIKEVLQLPFCKVTYCMFCFFAIY